MLALLSLFITLVLCGYPFFSDDVFDSHDDCDNYNGICLLSESECDDDTLLDYEGFMNGLDFYNDGSDSDFDFDEDEYSLHSFVPNDPADNYILSVHSYLREISRNSPITPQMRIRILDFLLFISIQRTLDAIELSRNFRSELTELSGLPYDDYTLFDGSTVRRKSGLNDSEIATLPRHIYRGLTQKEIRTGESPHKCCICMAEMDVGEELVRLDKCAHRYHFGCFESWLKRVNQCPVCRTKALEPTPIVIN